MVAETESFGCPLSGAEAPDDNDCAYHNDYEDDEDNGDAMILRALSYARGGVRCDEFLPWMPDGVVSARF